MEKIKVNRCTKPKEATGNPILVIFSDGSNAAYGACAYARWRLINGDHETNLILPKNRLTPSKKLSIDRIELCGAVLNKRLKTIITEQCMIPFRAMSSHHRLSNRLLYDPKRILWIQYLRRSAGRRNPRRNQYERLVLDRKRI